MWCFGHVAIGGGFGSDASLGWTARLWLVKNVTLSSQFALEFW